MGIFRRRGKDADVTDETGQEAVLESTDDAERDALGADDAADVQTVDTDDTDDTDGTDATDHVEQAEESEEPEDEEPFNRARGPFDLSEVDDADTDLPDGELPERLDLGAIRFVPIDGMQLRLELDEAQETVLSAHAVVGESSLQLQAFAAPRTFPVWPDIRAEIAESIAGQGGTADVVDGALGRELLCRMPQRGPDGRTVFAQVRFCGIDGPRWFLRAVLSGKAAVDEAAAAPLVDLVRSVVVVRGDGAMPPREVLPLQLPAGAQTDEAPPEEAPTEADADPRLDDLKPFERGPEITEVR